MRQSKSQQTPLIYEDYPDNYHGYPFISLVCYRKENKLSIIDNVSDKEINLYDLDMCKAEHIIEQQVIEIALHWFENSRDKYPVSVEFSRRNLSGKFGRIYRSYNLEFVTRVIGPAPRFDITEVHSIKRRKKKKLAPGIMLTETAANRRLSSDKFR